MTLTWLILIFGLLILLTGLLIYHSIWYIPSLLRRLEKLERAVLCEGRHYRW